MGPTAAPDGMCAKSATGAGCGAHHGISSRLCGGPSADDVVDVDNVDLVEAEDPIED